MAISEKLTKKSLTKLRKRMPFGYFRAFADVWANRYGVGKIPSRVTVSNVLAGKSQNMEVLQCLIAVAESHERQLNSTRKRLNQLVEGEE